MLFLYTLSPPVFILPLWRVHKVPLTFKLLMQLVLQKPWLIILITMVEHIFHEYDQTNSS